MTLLENEVVNLRGYNRCKKKDFFLLSMITSLHVVALGALVSIFAKNYVRPVVVLIITVVMYLLYVLFQNKKTYKDYNRFFGRDEIVITDERVYYNVCMNKVGEYKNFDSFMLIGDITFLEIKKGLYPKRLKIYYGENNEYIIVHSLANALEIKNYLQDKIANKDTK